MYLRPKPYRPGHKAKRTCSQLESGLTQSEDHKPRPLLVWQLLQQRPQRGHSIIDHSMANLVSLIADHLRVS